MLASGISSAPSDSPRWLLTNGDKTVGPVHTELLLRGTRGALLPPGQAVLARPGCPDSLLAVLPPLARAGARPRIRLVS